jgi:hypothetical protein
MKTIFDKIDSSYLHHAVNGLECTSGTCQHSIHNVNSVWWILLGVALVCTASKYYYGTYGQRNKEG